MRVVATSLLINAVQRHPYCVDNNLPGVSGQVTASGVLVFAEIFGELSLGNGGRAKTPSEKFASGNFFGNAPGGAAARFGQPKTRRGHPGLHRVDSFEGLGFRDDVERDLDVDFRVQVHHHRMRAHRLDVGLG